MKSIRKIRKEKKLTLEDLSQKTGYTIGYLSQLERQLRTPTLNTLRKIAFAFDLDVTDLLSDDNPGSDPVSDVSGNEYILVKKGERNPLYIDELDLTYEIIMQNHTNTSKIKAMVCVLKPGDQGTGSRVEHTTDEFILVLKGDMYCELGDASIKMTEGDSLLIPAKCPHTFKNQFDKPAEILMVLS